MARKKSMQNEPKKLDPKDFFEWKLELSKIKEAKLKKELEETKFANQVKDVELTKLKAQVLELRAAKVKESLSEYGDAVKKAEENYQQYKKLLEERVGVNLSNSAVNELTYEIVSLNND